MAGEFDIVGSNAAARFSLRVHRGEGMALLAMDWRNGQPPADFVGFSIEYRPPSSLSFFALSNRLAFTTAPANVGPNPKSTLFAPIQKFRWVHFPYDPEQTGAYRYRVRPAFMDAGRTITWGDAQEVDIELRRETYPGVLNVAFARGFVSSQAFVDRYESAGKISTLLPSTAAKGLTFQPTHPKTADALAWMGFEARSAILQVLDEAIADVSAEVRVVAYDLNEPEIVGRLEQLGARLKVIIDDDGDHGAAGSAEDQAEARLKVSAGSTHVKRQHMGKLQHNKTIVVQGDSVQAVVCGSTNFSWRGLYVQANNAIVLRGIKPAKVFRTAFDGYWAKGVPATFGVTLSTSWRDLGLPGIDAKVSFSPHASSNARLKAVSDDIGLASSSVLYSLAFLYMTTKGPVFDAIKKVTDDPDIFVYGMSDKKVGGGIDMQLPDGKVAPLSPQALTEHVPQPFKREPSAAGGVRMHHKFVVIDFDKPTARVYTGSYNFSGAADLDNGENLVRIRDRRIAVAYMVEALRLFDHYHFRVKQLDAATAATTLELKEPPTAGNAAWWLEDYTDPVKIRDRKTFA